MLKKLSINLLLQQQQHGEMECKIRNITVRTKACMKYYTTPSLCTSKVKYGTLLTDKSIISREHYDAPPLPLQQGYALLPSLPQNLTLPLTAWHFHHWRDSCGSEAEWNEWFSLPLVGNTDTTAATTRLHPNLILVTITLLSQTLIKPHNSPHQTSQSPAASIT